MPGLIFFSSTDAVITIVSSLQIGDKFARSAQFTHYDPSTLIGFEVTGSTLGIVGLGRIGREVARRARAFDMRIVYHNRRRDEAAERELGVTYRSLPELLAESDFVTLTCPLTPETTNLIGAKEFALMKPTGILINVARGPIIDQQALTTVLRERRIAGAALDVFEQEPIAVNDPLLGFDNVILSPHAICWTDELFRGIGQEACRGILDVAGATISGEVL